MLSVQELLFPREETCAVEQMYYRADAARFDGGAGELRFDKGARADFDAYFNGFSICKWVKYTQLDNLRLRLRLRGAFRVETYREALEGAADQKSLPGARVSRLVLEERECRSDEPRDFEFELPCGRDEAGMLAFSLCALKADSAFLGGAYETDERGYALNRTDIAIDICTFRRESYVIRNLKALDRELIRNPEGGMYGHLEVFVSDNGRTLDIPSLETERIHIYPNKNVGGSGGFARGMIEILRNGGRERFSHVLVMDDDVTINPDAILRTYRLLTLLKPEYLGKTIAGAMMRLDVRSMQYENCAWWNGEYCTPAKNKLDMRDIKNVLFNEVEEKNYNFNAWWYSCIPMDKVSEKSLPLPLFIRFDDVEFGLRTGGDILSVNGICLWHEPFENKYSTSMEYYHMRNALILNSFYRPDLGAGWAAHRLRYMTLSNVTRYRYNATEQLFRAVEDFCKGPEWLMKNDAESLHKSLLASGEKLLPVEQLSVKFDEALYRQSKNEPKEGALHRLFRLATFNGLLLPAKGVAIVDAAVNSLTPFYRRCAVLNYEVGTGKGVVNERDFMHSVRTMLTGLRYAAKLKKQFPAVSEEYRKQRERLMSAEFWKEYLGID